MTIVPSKRLSDWLKFNGFSTAPFMVNVAELDNFFIKAKEAHPRKDVTYWNDWALYTIRSRQLYKSKELPKSVTIPIPKFNIWKLVFEIGVILLLSLIGYNTLKAQGFIEADLRRIGGSIISINLYDSGNEAVQVSCVAGCVAGGSFTDDNAFTGGGTAVGPVGFLFDATPPTITDGNAGISRMNSSRIAMFDLFSLNGVTLLGDNSANSTVKIPTLQALANAADPSWTEGRQVPASVSLTGYMRVTCDNCGGSTFADDDPFTISTTSILNTGWLFDDVGPAAATENSAAIPRMSSNRNPYFQIRDGAGNERGANVDASNRLEVAVLNTPTVTIGTFPDNEPFDLNQLVGNTHLVGAGNTGTGSPRVTISTDQAALPTMGHGATGSAVPSGATQIGGRGSDELVAPVVCDTWTPISLTVNTQIITGASGDHVYICSINLMAHAATNVAVVTGTGTICATGIAGVFGGSTAATGWPFAINGGIAMGNGMGVIGRTDGTGDNICILVSAANQISGNISYAIF